MKYFINFFIISIFLILINSCKDNGVNIDKNDFKKLKMTIYEQDRNDTSKLVKKSEYYFDGDVDGIFKRTFLNLQGYSNYKSILHQYRANVPLPYNKYGCLIKNIEYSKDGSYFEIIDFEYDESGYLSKGVSTSYSSSYKSSYSVLEREGEKLIKNKNYSDNILQGIIEYFYNSEGLCVQLVRSDKDNNLVSRGYSRYNDKKELIYTITGKDTTKGNVTEYFYDNLGNNIKQISYNKENNDTNNTRVYNWIMYKGYRMKEEDIDKYEFDSENNIISYINVNFGNTKYVIAYEYY